MVFLPSVRKLLWALTYAALPNVDCHLHDVIKGMDVSSGGTVLIHSRFYILSSHDAGLNWNLLATPHAITGSDRNEIIMSPDFDEDGVVFYGGKYRSKDSGENWQAIKVSGQGFSYIQNSCAQTHKDGMAFHPQYNSKFPEVRQKMVMMATSSKGYKAAIWVSDDIDSEFRKLNLSRSSSKGYKAAIWVSDDIDSEFRKLNLSWSIKTALSMGKCPMLATMGDVIYLATQSMAVFGTVDFGKSWSVVLPAQANGEVVMQLQVDQTSAKAGHEADTLVLVTENRVYQMKPRMKKQFPLTFFAPTLVPIVLPDSSPDHPINVVATHRGPGEESSTFISRTQCPTKQVCQDTSNDNVLTSHNITGHTWSKSEITDWFGKDRADQPASHWKIPEFSDIKGVTGTPRVYIGTYTGIYRSDDGGGSWLELD
eukprot:CAMPEP_0194298544 /NCGR_PEP_ID=MMETSP0169-20130528/60225_1 /TAXON_ID=218684 /ORGANISM="Corethron pennatum, Strain L29A3" /LENGTH=424 /DNA_ID=CAMNT_0039048545 /DNA_START=146 /DNA_END=1417 /DNA_ORIENTATION=+